MPSEEIVKCVCSCKHFCIKHSLHVSLSVQILLHCDAWLSDCVSDHTRLRFWLWDVLCRFYRVRYSYTTFLNIWRKKDHCVFETMSGTTFFFPFFPPLLQTLRQCRQPALPAGWGRLVAKQPNANPYCLWPLPSAIPLFCLRLSNLDCQQRSGLQTSNILEFNVTFLKLVVKLQYLFHNWFWIIHLFMV